MVDAKGARWDRMFQFRSLLVLSLGLNLFLGGYVVGAYLNRAMHPPAFGPGGPGGLQGVVERLRGQISAEGMQKIDALRADIDAQFRQRLPKGEDIRVQLQQIVSDNQFDQKEFLAVIDRLNDMRTISDREIAARIAAVLSQLSTQDRRVIARVMLTQIVPPPPPPSRR